MCIDSPSLSPFIKDAKGVPRLGGRKLRPGLRRGGTIDKEAFAAGLAEKLSQDVSCNNTVCPNKMLILFGRLPFVTF